MEWVRRITNLDPHPQYNTIQYTLGYYLPKDIGHFNAETSNFFPGVVGKQNRLKNKNAIYIAVAFHFFQIFKVKNMNMHFQYLIWCCIGANRTN